MFNNPNIVEKIKDAKKNNKVLFFHKAITNVPNWNSFINNLNYKFNKKKEHLIFEDKRMINDVLIYNKMDPSTFNILEESTESNTIIEAENVLKIFNEIMELESGCVKSLINFVGNEAKYYIHADEHDVFSWHCIGQVEWRIYPNIILDKNIDPPTDVDEPYESYILNPGDVLYVPKGVVHQVIVNQPRASIVYNYYY